MKYQLRAWHGESEIFLSIEGLRKEKVIDPYHGELERWFADIEDLQKFSEKHGNIMLWKPSESYPYWTLLLDDKNGHFRQM